MEHRDWRGNPPTIRATTVDRRQFIALAGSLSPLLLYEISQELGSMSTQKSEFEVEVVHTRVFAAGPGGGNPCPVVLRGDALSDSQMLELARQFGEDTAFVLRPSEPRTEVRIRYFVPHHEMGISGHATVAAITVAVIHGIIRCGRARIETISGLFDTDCIHRRGEYSVVVGQNEPVFGGTATAEAVAPALRIAKEDIDCTRGPIQAVSVSRPKLLVPVRNWEVLDRLSPDYEALWRLCDEIKVTGLYPFTRHTNKRNAQAEARQFPLRAGFPEDAATGVAAAALGAYLTRYDLASADGRHEFHIAQGYAMGRPSMIEVLTGCANRRIIRTAIRGTAEVVLCQQIRPE